MVSGAALIAEMLAKGLAAKGHDVLVLAASDRKEAYVTQNGRLRVARLRSYNNPFRAKQRSLLWPQKELAGQLTKFQPDIIHLHEPLALGLAGLRQAQRLSIPVVLTLHQLPWFVSAYLPALPGLQQKVESLLWRYGRWFLGQCSATITLTHMVGKETKTHTGVQPFVIGAGIDHSRFKPNPTKPTEALELRQKYGLDTELPILLHVGRLDADKQVDRVIRTSARVMADETCQLLVVGDGHHRERLETLSQELGIGDGCHFPGFVATDGDLPGLYRAASLFVTASEIETFGLVVLEAMASGLPVVGPQATCLPELVKEGQNGYLTCPGSEMEMADRMRLLIREPQKAQKMGVVGRVKAMDYTADNVIARHELLFTALCGKNPKRSPFPKGKNQQVAVDELLPFPGSPG
jgi:glycosyltransferase involved in cell wall biosynthesis